MGQLIGSIMGLLLIAGLALVLRWTLSAMASRRTAESLTPEDLQVLEQAAARLVDEIKLAAEIAVRDLDERCEKLRTLTIEADHRLALLARAEVFQLHTPARDRDSRHGFESVREQVYKLSDAGLDVDEISRRVGVPSGEVTLLLGLRPCVPNVSAG